MSSGPTQDIVAARQHMNESNEPLVSEDRSVIDQDGQLVHNVPAVARRVLGIKPGGEVQIDIYDDHYVVTRVLEGEDDG